MSKRKQILSALAEEYLDYINHPMITELGQFSSYILARNTRRFAIDNELEWDDLREALIDKTPFKDKDQQGLIIKCNP